MKNMGDGRRVARVEREVQSIISTFIIQRLQSELPGLITVAKVMIPADLRSAKVFVSLLQANIDQEQAVDLHPERAEKAGKKISDLDRSIQILQSWAPDIQDEIGAKLNMKYLPKLTFYPDESTNKILKIEKILSDIKGPNSVGDDDLDD
ncbi:MAG: ribosome-binding factor A [Pseudobdellovibrio sp.]